MSIIIRLITEDTTGSTSEWALERVNRYRSQWMQDRKPRNPVVFSQGQRVVAVYHTKTGTIVAAMQPYELQP